jgi:hypothetical protein
LGEDIQIGLFWWKYNFQKKQANYQT